MRIAAFQALMIWTINCIALNVVVGEYLFDNRRQASRPLKLQLYSVCNGSPSSDVVRILKNSPDTRLVESTWGSM